MRNQQKLPVDVHKVGEHVHHAFHVLHRNAHIAAVKVGSARGKVGAGKPGEAQVRTVGAAADGLHFGRDAARFKGSLGGLHHFHVLVDHAEPCVYAG